MDYNGTALEIEKVLEKLEINQLIDIINIIISLFGVIIIPILLLRFFNKREKQYQLKLDKELEVYKSKMNNELELLKIDKEHLQEKRIEEAITLIEDYFLKMFDKEYIKKLDQPKEKLKFVKLKHNVALKLYLFASDEAVKIFVDMDNNSKNPNELNNKYYMVIRLADLFTQLRKDMGYPNTKCNRDDILTIMLTDWHLHKDEYNEYGKE